MLHIHILNTCCVYCFYEKQRIIGIRQFWYVGSMKKLKFKKIKIVSFIKLIPLKIKVQLHL